MREAIEGVGIEVRRTRFAKDYGDRLEAAGFRETNVQELFGLTPEETELIETKIALSRLLRSEEAEKPQAPW